MARFCTRCGRPLQEGEVCNCSGSQKESTHNPTPNIKDFSKIEDFTIKEFIESMKNRMGIGDPELNKGDAFEKGKQIIPDCVKSNESEIPIKQYTIATLKKRILGIPYVKAIGRLQVTNQRVIFRAPGRCLAGRTTLQHEFSINEIAGIEARREYIFAFWAFLVGLFFIILGGAISSGLIAATLIKSTTSGSGGNGVGAVIAFIIGVAGCIPFFMIKKKWLLKLFCLGIGFQALNIIRQTGSAFFTILSVIVLLFLLFNLLVYCIRPNFVLFIKTKSSSAAVDIKRRKGGFFGMGQEDHTGFDEILPEDDAEKCIREIDAMISDIQKLGDFGIEKWKVKESDGIERKSTV